MKQQLKKSSAGFTMIELMAMIIVMFILIVGAGAAYLRFLERNRAEIVATELQRFVVATRQRARTLDREGCSGNSGVVGYFFRYNTASTPPAIAEGRCGGDKANPLTGVQVAQYTPSQSVDTITLGGSTSFNMIFWAYSVYGGTNLSGDVPVVVTNGGASYSFTITQGGEITAVERL